MLYPASLHWNVPSDKCCLMQLLPRSSHFAFSLSDFFRFLPLRTLFGSAALSVKFSSNPSPFPSDPNCPEPYFLSIPVSFAILDSPDCLDLFLSLDFSVLRTPVLSPDFSSMQTLTLGLPPAFVRSAFVFPSASAVRSVFAAFRSERPSLLLLSHCSLSVSFPQNCSFASRMHRRTSATSEDKVSPESLPVSFSICLCSSKFFSFLFLHAEIS